MLRTRIRRAFQAVAGSKKDDHIDNLACLEGSVKYLAIDIYQGHVSYEQTGKTAWQMLKEYGQVAAEQERRNEQQYGR